MCVAVGCAPALAQDSGATAKPRTSSAAPAVAADASLNLPDKQVWLGTAHLPVRVMADGKALAAGTYRVRLTGEHAANDVVGQNDQLERWVEFVQGSTVKGRALAPVVPPQSAKEVAHEPLPTRGTVRVERLKEDAYYRVWFNYHGDQVMIYLPIA
jgi:hypothetical protein